MTVGVVIIEGVGPRVGLSGLGMFAHYSPASARRRAPAWESPDVTDADLHWVAEALRKAADEVEAMTATRQ